MDTPPTIGFETLRGSGSAWQGGATYFSDLMRAVQSSYPQAHLMVVEASHGTPAPDEMVTLAERVVAYPSLKRGSAGWALNHARHRVLNADLLPDRVLKQQGIHVLVCGILERRTNLPTLAYIPDLQHRRLPQMFSPEELRWRDKEYLKTLDRASMVFVSTNAVREDIIDFAPQFADKVRLVPPVSYIPPDIFATDPQDLLSKYNLPAKFVYLPNQFWKHKNHMNVFDAVRRLKAQGQSITLVCTGTPVDWREPAYFSEILQAIAHDDIHAQIILLGRVSRAEVFALIRQSIAVLNPSRFEGFGLSLSEARGVGKRVLASNIPAHRDQRLECITYFDPMDPSDLAEKLGTLWTNTSAGPDLLLEQQARTQHPQRVRAYADEFMQLVHEVLK